jgi:hypothetical protein
VDTKKEIVKSKILNSKVQLEGGLEVIVEDLPYRRVRIKRCKYWYVLLRYVKEESWGEGSYVHFLLNFSLSESSNIIIYRILFLYAPLELSIIICVFICRQYGPPDDCQGGERGGLAQGTTKRYSWTCKHTCIYTCIYLYTCLYINVYEQIYIYIYIYIYICICRYLSYMALYIYIYIYVYIYTYIWMLVYIFVYVYTHVYVSTYIYMNICV